MNPSIHQQMRKRERGQTIIVAMIILGLLLILGFVFIGIINRNIQTSGRLQDRSVANDLSEAGIRYAHAQMLRSELGADWRGTPTPPVTTGAANDLSIDPDAFYLRPAAFLSSGQRARFGGVNAPFDQGGPDGLGPFIRVNFTQGRSLFRVRWSQSDANLFRTNPLGALRSPGLARNYLIIESVGREGRVNVNDPTTLNTGSARRIQNFASQVVFEQEMAAFREAQARFGNNAVQRAFASIGVIEHARFITNKFRASRPAEIGGPQELGAVHRDDTASVAQNLVYRLGGEIPLVTVTNGSTASLPTTPFPGGGSMHVNGDLKLFGRVQFNLNRPLGDAVTVAGAISSDDNSALVNFNVSTINGGGNWTTTVESGTATAAQIRSGNPAFSTFNGLLRDGENELDVANRPRGVGRKDPPSIAAKDPQTGATRYVAMARDSGIQSGMGNSGRYGYGRNVYVGNGNRRQQAVDPTSRMTSGGESSLVSEWLSPGGDPSTTGWRGWLYTPPGAYMVLLPDGFTITLDGEGDDVRWRNPDGSLTNESTNRYRLGRGSDGRLHIVNTFTFPDPNTINGNLNTGDFDQGPEFGGVVTFEGNVRVRGVIPTDIQLTVVSNATVYVEGSITKGVTGNQWTASYPAGIRFNVGQRLTRLSRSMLMLMAKDYVTLNTTQFFGPSRSQQVLVKEDVPTIGAFNPLVMRSSDPEGLRTLVDFALDPGTDGGNPTNPSTWRPYVLGYAPPSNPSARMPSNLLLAHTMDNGAATASFYTLDVNRPAGNSTYLFPGSDNSVLPPLSNLASEFVAGTYLPLYGLGAENFERYNQVEQIAFPFVNPGQVTLAANGATFTSTSPFGGYTLLQNGLNELQFRPTSVGGLATNDTLFGRVAVTPHDIRIEASLYAEEGSFFVIPGPWFNPNPNDTFARWNRVDDNGGATLSGDEKNLRRLQEFGSYPSMPFFGEPLDVRIQVVGAVSENLPVPMSVQAEWMRKWGWIPEFQGSSGVSIPTSHARGTDLSLTNIVPNLTITYDPVLATGRLNGFSGSGDPNDPASPVVRVDDFGRPLPPLPRLPVSPTLAFFGEVR